MIPHDVEIKKIAIVTVTLSVILVVIAITIFDVSPNLLPLKVGVMTSVIGLFWFLYDKYLWNIRPFRMMGWLCSTPNINGRWVGTVDRDGENSPHRFVMEVRQTMTKIKFYTYGQKAKGESIAVKMVKDELGEQYKLIAYWKTRGAKLDDETKFDSFTGVSVIDLCINGNDKQMNGYYFTDREPVTRGKTDLKWVSAERLGRSE